MSHTGSLLNLSEDVISLLCDPENTKRTPTAVLNEIAISCNCRVDFKVVDSISSSAKTFMCTLRFGDYIRTKGTGSNKKDAKQRAAEKALELISEMAQSHLQYRKAILPSVDSVITGSASIQQGSHNPIGELQELAGQQHINNPSYMVVSEDGYSHDKLFTIEVQYNGFKCTGSGRNKKVAKRCAAEKMLALLKKEGPVPKNGQRNRLSSRIRNMPASYLTSSDKSQDDPKNSRTESSRMKFNFPFSQISPFKDEDFIIPLQKWKETEKLCTKEIDLQAINRLQERVAELGVDMKFHEIKERSKSDDVQCFVEVSCDPLCVQVGQGQELEEAQADAASNAIQFLDTVIEPARIMN